MTSSRRGVSTPVEPPQTYDFSLDAQEDDDGAIVFHPRLRSRGTVVVRDWAPAGFNGHVLNGEGTDGGLERREGEGDGERGGRMGRRGVELRRGRRGFRLSQAD